MTEYDKKERRSGVATRFWKDNSVTVAVHSCAHSLNLCFKILEDSIQDVLERVKGISWQIFFLQNIYPLLIK